MDDEQRLLLAALNGDRLAQARVFDECLLRTIRAHVRSASRARWLSGEALNDAVQQVCMAILERVPSCPVNHPRAFLAVLARNVMISNFRKAQRTPTAQAEALEHSSFLEQAVTPVSTEQQLLTRLELEQAWSTVSQYLSERQRDIVLLRYHHELEPREIALVLDTTPATISTELSRIRQRCALLSQPADRED